LTTFASIRSHWQRLATGGLALFSLLTWALASPSASAPDDDLHIANIYCLHDSTTCRADDWLWPWGSTWWAADPSDRIGPEYQGARKAYPDLWQYEQPRALPCYVTNGDSWYNPDASLPADCLTQEPSTNTPASLDDLGYYPSLYYRFASLFTGDTIRESVVHWRVLNVLMGVAIFATSLLLSAPTYRRTLSVATLVAYMPLGLFLIASTNPSAWLLIGTTAFLGPAVTVLRDRGSHGLLVARVIFATACLLMILGGRSEGAIHAAVAIVVALLLGLKAPRRVYCLLASAGALLGFVALGLLSRGDATKAQSVLALLQSGLNSGHLWDAVVSTPSFFFGSDVRLGWLEVLPPSAAVIAARSAFWGAAAMGLAAMFWRKAIALLVVAGVLLVVPAALVAGGSQVPPTRYFLPLVYMLAFVFLAPDWGKWLPRWSNAQWIALGAALSVANSLSLLFLTVRYVSGIQPGTTNPLSLATAGTPDWWWGAWLSPFANWLMGSVAFAIAVGLLFNLPNIREGAEYNVDNVSIAEPGPRDQASSNRPNDPQLQVPACRKIPS